VAVAAATSSKWAAGQDETSTRRQDAAAARSLDARHTLATHTRHVLDELRRPAASISGSDCSAPHEAGGRRFGPVALEMAGAGCPRGLRDDPPRKRQPGQ
jgi:hypothetical protein